MTKIYTCGTCGRTEEVRRYAKCQACTLIRRFWSKVDKNGPVPAHKPEVGPCWVWTACRKEDGRGLLFIRPGRKESAPRAAFFLAHGRWPTPEACHHCDHPPCVKAVADEHGPAHIYEGTHKENMADMARKNRSAHGTRSGVSVLTPEDIRAIITTDRRLVTQKDLAIQYGVSKGTISDIFCGRQWRRDAGSLPPCPRGSYGPRGDTHGMSRLTAEAVVDIRRLAKDGVPNATIARMYGVNKSTVGLVVMRRTWTHVEEAM